MTPVLNLQSTLAENQLYHKVYWLNQLSGDRPETSLLTDYLRPEQSCDRNRCVSFELGARLSASILQISQASDFSSYLLLLSAFSSLLRKYTHSDDLIVGIPTYDPASDSSKCHEPQRSQGADQILPVRLKLSADLSFRDLLLRVKAATIQAHAHQNYPLDQVFDALALPQQANRHPLYDIVVLLDNIHRSPTALNHDLTVAWRIHDWPDDRPDDQPDDQPNGKHISGRIEYSDALFKRETIETLIRYFINGLEQAIAHPDIQISQINLLNDQDTYRLLKDFNPNAQSYPVEQTIQSLFEAQVERSPDRIAAVCQASQLTYRDLNAEANRLARLLRQLGLDKGDFVGILQGRDLNFLRSILAILKAGAAYVPIDSAYPPERIRYMLTHSEVKVLLTDAIAAEQITAQPQQYPHLQWVICLQAGGQFEIVLSPPTVSKPALAARDFSGENLDISGSGRDWAYMLYTSGSTGLPKGAIVRHDGAINHIYGQFDALALDETLCFLQSAPASSDISVWQFLAPLLVGGCTVIVTTETVCDPQKLFQTLQTHPLNPVQTGRSPHEKTSSFQTGGGLTLVELVPVVLKGLIDYVAQLPSQMRSLPHLKWMMITGEYVPVELVNQWLRLYPDIPAVNAYGPTEAADDITQCIVETPLPKQQRSVPIGKPLANLNLYVLDPQMQLVPVGMLGEICVSGIGVGDGYWQNPEKTKLSFVPNPFAEDDRLWVTPHHETIYKTGDLGRWLPDGTLEYLGRLDHQVKIRGFRIELGEIEAALSQHPDVKTGVVIVKEASGENKRLVAYVVPDTSIDVRDLRRFLDGKLPDHMVPSAFVPIEQLPLTPSGKIDRKALAALEGDAPILSESDLATTPVEEILIGIWGSVLGCDRIGIHDNFFDLGGHSLLATLIISQVRRVFQLELPLRRLFECPTVRQLATAVESDAQGLAAPPIEPGSSLSLSFAQQRLWFLSQLEPDNPFYNLPIAVRLQGDLNLTALEQTFNTLIERHQVLRTHIETDAGQPVAVLSSVSSILLSCTDLSPLAEGKNSGENGPIAAVQPLIAAEAQHPFDLSQDLLMRVKLLRLGPDDHILLITLHHIAADGWSIGVLVNEVAALYSAFVENQPSPLPALPIQYRDFAAWQRQWLQGDVLQTQLTYWREQLAGAPALLTLPTDYPRPAVQSFRGASYAFTLPSKRLTALQQLSRQAGCTLFMTLLAGFKILLSRYSGNDDIVVGTPIANRTRAETEGLIGLFVNTLALRTDLSDDPKVEELLTRVRDVALGAYAHQDLPFEQLVEALQPERSLSHSPLFQVMFILQNAPLAEIELPGLKLSPLDSDSGAAQFDLTLSMEETEAGLVGTFEYNTDLFEERTIACMGEHFQTLLAAMSRSDGAAKAPIPERRVSELPLLTAADQQQLSQWNQTQTEYPSAACIHQLFEAQVQRTPDAVAIAFKDCDLTYQQLNQRANQLAHYLQTLGVKPGVLVGLCCDRSLEMMIGLLGTLKAGGAYVPMDPDYPQERLAWMVSDTQMPILLTQASLQDRLPSHQAQVVCLDSDRQVIAQQPSQDLPSQDSGTLDSPSALAYVIYTSGSTGKPKGVQVLHSSGVNFLHSMQRQPGLTADDTLLAVTSISFDIAVLELFLPLITGARVVLASREIATDGVQLSACLTRAGATVMQATPATWRMLLAAGWQGSQGLKILCGGEALKGDLAAQLLESGAAVWNLYGPTETTIWSTVYRLETQPGNRGISTIPIGRPIANTQIYLLDRQGYPVPIGVAGELHIGGAGLARGYLNRPDLTDERFIEHPHWGRLYKTGDLARYRWDGTLEYLGRLDHQVKLRGFRVELGEIEAVLSQHPSVRETVVDHTDKQGDIALVAYWVAAKGQPAASTGDLRNFLQGKLPDYMVPAFFVMLEALPLTPNGKVDRKALPALETLSQKGVSEGDLSLRPALTPTEALLETIWAQVLRCDLIGIHHNFFELGGHSLLATQVISQIRQVFQVELPLRRLFECPTLAQLARAIEAATQAGQGLEAPPIEPRPHPDGIPLSYAQQRLWFLAQLEPDSPFYNLPVAVRLEGTLNVDALEQTFADMLRRHQVLRTAIATQQGEPFARLSPTPSLSLSPVDLISLPEGEQTAEVQKLIAAEAQQPFDLSQDLLMRVKLLRLGSDDHILLVTLHHIAADGWSIGVLVNEVAALYSAFVENQPSPLPALPIQYGDFAAWQRQWLQGEVLQTQLTYWGEQLVGAPARLALPTDHPRPAVQSFRGASYTVTFSPEQLTALHQLSRQAGCTLFMTLLAGFQILLSRYSGSDDIVVGTPIANRTRAETEGLIGLFVNTLALRTDLSDEPTVGKLLTRVRDVALGAYAHQDLPFEQLVEALQPERSLSHSPLFQVMFILQNAPLPEIELSGLTLRPLESDSGAAQFDLTLAMEETEAGLVGAFEYNTDLFEETTIARMAAHYQTLLTAMVADLEQPVSKLPLLTDAEQQQLAQWNQTQTDYPQSLCLHQCFEAQVQRTPDAIALVFEDQPLTYSALNAKANQLAHHLRSLGVQPEDLVGICCDRTPEMVIGLLGILKAGGAYVPLDPHYPQDRLAWMVSDSQMSVLLTQRALCDRLPPHQAQVVCLDSDGDAIAAQPSHSPPSVKTTNPLAYVIYTSGSTGKPKGVQILHRSVVNFLLSMQRQPGLTAEDTLLAVTSISFDIAVLELFLPLITGARLVLASREIAADGRQLSQVLTQTGATVMQATPATWRMLLAAGWTGQSGLKILCGGEALSGALAQQLMAMGAAVWNLYGPTETTIWSAVYRLGAQQRNRMDFPVPIGHPIANTQLHILDCQGNSAPIGVAGELHIGGDGLARGYLNRPDLTAERFIHHPRWGRLYRTGDLARYRLDGAIDYLGRVDHQVKIRGFRIELGEIEAVLSEHSAIREAVAIAHKDPVGEARLVAYVVFQPGLQMTHSDLRDILQARLPDYMVPSFLVSLDALPLTPNGKVDRRALPAPDMARNEADRVLPRNDLETELSALYAEILGLETLSIHDNFFDLGGHSLLATRLISRLREVFDLELPLRRLFEKPTIADLAEHIEIVRLSIANAHTPVSDIGNRRKEIEL